MSARGADHAAETLARIKQSLLRSYPAELYDYCGQDAFLRVDGKRYPVRPDYQIFRRGNPGRPVCVVEVGYTDAEKIRLYNALKVPDVRWYGRDGRLVEPEITTAREVVEMAVLPVPQDPDRWKAFDPSRDAGPGFCPELSDMFWNCREVFKKASSLFALRPALRNRILLDHELGPRNLVDALARARREDDPAALEELCYEQSFFTALTVWTNGHYIFATVYCDPCGAYRLFYDRDDLLTDSGFALLDCREVLGANQVSRSCTALELPTLVQEHCGLDLEFQKIQRVNEWFDE